MEGTPRTRRTFIGQVAAVGAAGAVQAPGALAASRRRRPKRRVAVLGAGVAGLTAAQELAERGFAVTVYERGALGGKSRTIRVPDSGVGGRRDLPGEHGFRVIAGFYQNLPDQMRRIPFPGNPDGVFGNLVATGETRWSRDDGRADMTLVWPVVADRWTPENIQKTIVASLEHSMRIPPWELAYFARQIVVYMTSSDERRFGQWEHMSWWDYMNADRFSEDYQRVFASAFSRVTQAAYAKIASGRSFAHMWAQFVYAASHRPPGYGDVMQCLNGPSNDVWLDPWIAHLRRLGVRFRTPATVESLELRRGRITGAWVRGRRGRERIEADWFVCALPVEAARKLWSRRILAADPRLEAMRRVRTNWMNGVQFFLDRPMESAQGHIGYVDSAWSIASIHQQQFWPEHQFAEVGDGRVRDCLSVCVSNWHDPGIVYGKPARELQPAQVAREVWEQIKAHLDGDELTDDMLLSWFVDPTIKPPQGGRRYARNELPLFITTVGSWDARPGPITDIPNLFLASDYVQTTMDQAMMESACEAARAAVGGLLDAAGSAAPAPHVFQAFEAPELAELRRQDAERFRRGEPHVLAALDPLTEPLLGLPRER